MTYSVKNKWKAGGLSLWLDSSAYRIVFYTKREKANFSGL